MFLEIAAVITSLGLLLILLLVFSWAVGLWRLHKDISIAIETEALPRRWLFLCIFPPFGRWFFDGYQNNWQPLKLMKNDYEVNVTRDVSNANWLLVQEHIDDPFAIRKGSTLTALNIENAMYQFRETEGLPAEDSLLIRVTTPRRSYSEPEWAEMSYVSLLHSRKSGWVIRNIKNSTPLLIRYGGRFLAVGPGDKSEILEVNSKIYLGTATYSLLKLPSLGIRLVNNEGKTCQEIHELCFIGAQDTCTYCVPESKIPLVAIFDQGILTVFHGAAVAITGFSGDTNCNGNRAVKNNQYSRSYKLILGDKIVIEGISFIVDYI